MKRLLILLPLLVLCSCGKPVKEKASVYNGTDGKDGDSCVTEQFDLGVTITCGDTTSAIYNGKDGVDGQDGADGVDGQDGTDGRDGIDGQDGEQGPTGPQGEPGQDAVGIQILTFTASSCQQILSTGVFVKYNGTNATLYSSDGCASNTKLDQVNDGESYWITNTLLGIKSENTFRVIDFGV